MPATPYDDHERRRDNHEIFDRLNKVEQSVAVMQTKADGYVTMTALQSVLMPFERNQLSLDNKITTLSEDIREGQLQNKIQNDKMVVENEKMLERLALLDGQKSNAEIELLKNKLAESVAREEANRFVNQLKNWILPALTTVSIILGIAAYLHLIPHVK